MTQLTLRGITVSELLNALPRGPGVEREIHLTTTRDGNVLHYHDTCPHGTHLSRPCFECETGKP